MANVRIVEGDLLDQNVEVIVNAWNRNIIPWWLLLPQGVSGAIKRKGGLAPFFALGKLGAIPLGKAVCTKAGKLPYRAIIHVAGINMWWRASPYSIRESVRSAIEIANREKFQSLAFPIIGAGSGGFKEDAALEHMLSALSELTTDAEVLIVKYRRH
ncbi:macro domain-containing protein [Undibacterium cyanobacteriorum]|uniref:Macro domain-containing protein n=1 Tax=Undibacterium cyanobacteriorum TaxID=3073561 RepID=A0ABY9RFQ8_9BURK|nr:macro domain-containing protein [Undibacterium sp. 20NA77.5]WMW80063.1 macro domain-containing protein [Undibacterium sp. 20NA77.5]